VSVSPELATDGLPLVPLAAKIVPVAVTFAPVTLARVVFPVTERVPFIVVLVPVILARVVPPVTDKVPLTVVFAKVEVPVTFKVDSNEAAPVTVRVPLIYDANDCQVDPVYNSY
jgi:hypothetical protein